MNGHLPSSEASAGTITLQVRVPYRVVGLVVGPKGATIKRIQQQTHTYIVTPSRDKEPVFEVTGEFNTSYCTVPLLLQQRFEMCQNSVALLQQM